jgi:tetrapyrrole methylase family protein/MazG family protein
LENSGINKLLDIVKQLRAPSGCPWDMEQTHKSCKIGLIEESYEAVDAIDKEDFSLLKEELGDVLLQVVFHSQIAEENGNFNFDEVCEDISNKLIVRHPHVFGDVKVKDTEDVLKNWDKGKKEKKDQSYTDTLKDIPASFPALMRAAKVGKRAGNANMDFPDTESALNSLENEVGEFKSAIKSTDNVIKTDLTGYTDIERITEELGDILFSAVNVARKSGIDPEDALNKSTNKFISRFEKVEKAVIQDGLDMKDLDITQLDIYWDKVKRNTD